MGLLEAILSAIAEYLIIDVSLVLAVTIGVVLTLGVILAFYNRKNVLFKNFTSEDEPLAKQFAGFNRLVEAVIRRLLNIHLKHQEAAGDLNIFREMAPQSSGEEMALEELIPHETIKTIVKLALRGFGWLMHPPNVRGAIYRASDVATLRATIYARGQAPYELERISRSISTPQLQDEIARELALKVILHLSPHLNIKDWRALDHLSKAIQNWPKDTMATQVSQQKFEVVEANLLEARRHDPDSPLINYNLALLYYYRYNAEDNAQARALFDKASRTSNLRLKGLAKIGLGRCYCQNYHRFGEQSPADLDKARSAAAEAVKLIEQAMRSASKAEAKYLKIDYARALYCRAFAQHVTEKPKDIEQGVQDYKRVIEITQPDVPAFVYNNLGYILMARGGRFVAGGDLSAYDEAVRYLHLALEREPHHKFALANLGNVERLRGNYREALDRYREAVEIDPGYINGWNEMAWVYLAAGQSEEADAAHQKALSLARSDNYRSEVKELYAQALFSVGRREEALGLAREAQALNPNNTSLNEWLAEVEAAVPKPSASSPSQ